MVITREQQIEARRIKVLELSAQGLTQEEVKQRLVTVSQKTLSNDLASWKQESIN